jgi:RHS repeat-associated protein
MTWWGSAIIREADWTIVQDAIGSVRFRKNVNTNVTELTDYYPFGSEKPSTTMNDRQKFGTYLRDAETGLDYANQRYFTSISGRFLTADPYRASGGAADPSSWNRYTYVTGDPINRFDRSGLQGQDRPPNYCDLYPLDPHCIDLPVPICDINPTACSPDFVPPPPPPIIPNSQQGIKGISSALNALRNASAACAQTLSSPARHPDLLVDMLDRGTVVIQNGLNQAYAFQINEMPDGSVTWNSVNNVLFGEFRGNGTVYLNGHSQFNDLTNVYVGTTSTGQEIHTNMLTSMEQTFGLSAGSLTPDKFWGIYLLHEFGHMMNGVGADKNNPEESRKNTAKVINACFPELLR